MNIQNYRNKTMKNKNGLNRAQRRHSDEKCDKPHVSKNMALLVYPDDLPDDMKKNPLENDNDYLRRLAFMLAQKMELHECFCCYACIHTGEIYTYEDYYKERELIKAVKRAYVNGTNNLNYLLHKSNCALFDINDVRADAIIMNDEQFCDKYCYVKKEWIGKKTKKTHIHFIWHYDHNCTYRFNVITCYERLKLAFGCSTTAIPGILKPIIPYGDINCAVRYLTHLDAPSKKKYSTSDIVCINCNDAEYRVLKGAPACEFGGQSVVIKHFAEENNITEYCDLLEALLNNHEDTMLSFASSAKGKYFANKAVEAVKAKINSCEENKKHNEFLVIGNKLAEYMRRISHTNELDKDIIMTSSQISDTGASSYYDHEIYNEAEAHRMYEQYLREPDENDYFDNCGFVFDDKAYEYDEVEAQRMYEQYLREPDEYNPFEEDI